MKKLFNKIKWHIVVAITVFGGTFWAMSTKQSGQTPEVKAGVNSDTVIVIKADTVKK